MKISSPQQKRIIWETFYEKTGQTGQNGVPIAQPKSFQLEKLQDAGSAKKKISDTIDQKTGIFNDKEIEFTPGEIAIIKDLFDAQSKIGFMADDAEAVLALKNTFDGKK